MTLCNVLAGKEGETQWMLVSQDFRGMQGLEASDNMRKIEYVAPHIVLASSGTANTAHEVFLAAKREVEQYKEPMVRPAAQSVYAVLQQEIDRKTFGGQKRTPTGSLEVGFMVAGIDSSGPVIYYIGASPVGNLDMVRVLEPFASIGSGSKTAEPTIKRWVKHFGGPAYIVPCDSVPMPMNEGVKCLTYAHLEAALYTPTVSSGFEVHQFTRGPDGLKASKVDSLPVVQMLEEIKSDEEYFSQKRKNPDVVGVLKRKQGEL